MSNIVEKFLDVEVELGKVEINGKTYTVVPPDNMIERHHIAYYTANAELLDIYAVEGVKWVESQDILKLASQFKLEAKVINPTRRMLEALLQQEPNTFARLKSKTILNAYTHVDKLVKDYQQKLLEELSESEETEEKGEEMVVNAPLDNKIG